MFFSSPAVRPVVLAEDDETIVERDVRQRWNAEETQVLLLVIAAALGERFPLEGQCRVHEHTPPDQLSNHAIELSGLHPLIQSRVLVPGFQVHAADGLPGAPTGGSRDRDALHMLDAADSPAYGVGDVPRMRDDSETGGVCRPRDCREQIAAELFVELDAIDAGVPETIHDGGRVFRPVYDLEPAANDGGDLALRRLVSGQADLAAEEIPRTAHAAAVEPLLERRLPVVGIAQVVDGRHPVRQEQLGFPVAVMDVRVDETRKDELAARVDGLNVLCRFRNDVVISAMTPSRITTCACSTGGLPVPSMSVPSLINRDCAWSPDVRAAATMRKSATVVRSAFLI